MKAEEVKENNILIARFMGGLIKGEGRLALRENEIWLHEHRTCNFKELQYHSEWNWLMPVLIKISQIEKGRFLYTINTDRIEMWDWLKRDTGFFYYSVFEGKPQNYNVIKGIYMAVVSFINWYNKTIVSSIKIRPESDEVEKGL